MIEPVWIWGAIGLTLLAVEIAAGTFYILWFGIAALFVAAVLWKLPNTTYAMQFMLFAMLSLGSLAIWRFVYKSVERHPRVGQAQGEEIGRIGIVINTVSPAQNGKIQFAQGVMGSREWEAVCDDVIEVGSHATVVAVEGNALRVSKNS